MSLTLFGIQSRENFPLNKSYLQIDLGAIASNYNALKQKVKPAECAVVVKANAYGLGHETIAKSLWDVGARSFFVATLEEGIALRSVLAKSKIFLLNGIMRGMESFLGEFSLIPVLASYDMVKYWSEYCQKLTQTLPCALQFNTGLYRLGLSSHDILRIFQDKDLMEFLNIVHVMSHLSASEDQENAHNEHQLESFTKLKAFFPHISASLGNSGGIFLKPSYYFDMVRPGISLYGIGIPENQQHHFMKALTLCTPILQVVSLKKGEKVGYDCTYVMPEDGRIAIASIGYADGYPHSLSNCGQGIIEGFKAPIAGRISMDLLTLDVTHVPESLVYPGQFVTLIGGELTVESLAKSAGMIFHEVLTGLGVGTRIEKIYV